MGEISEMMLEGFMDEETGEIIDGEAPGYPRRMSDRLECDDTRRPEKKVRCVVPGCKTKFRATLLYNDFVQHYYAKHGGKK